MSTCHAVPDGAGKYMVTMRDRWGAWRISQGGLDWRHARTMAKAAQADGHRGQLPKAQGYERTSNAAGESAGLRRPKATEVAWTPGSDTLPRLA